MVFSDPSATADLAVILMQEGLAHIFLIGRRYVKSLSRQAYVVVVGKLF